MSGLKDFIKRRLKDLQGDAHAVANQANRVIVKPVAHAGGNVVNALSAHSINQAADSNFNPVTATRKFVVEPTLHQGAALVRSTYDIGRGAAADITHNKVALENAHKAKMTDYPQVLAPVARPLAQAAETVLHPFSAHTVTPKTTSDRQIFGDAPIQNIQAGVKSNFQEHKDLPLIKRVPLAVAYGTGQVAQDALTIAGAKGGAKVLKEGAVDTAKTVGKNAKEVATNKPFRAISDQELTAANRFSMKRAGYPDNTKPGDYETYRNVQRKLGVDVNNHDAVDHMIGARMTYDTRMSQRPKVLLGEGGGYGTNYHKKGTLPHDNLAQEYADMLKQIDNGMAGGQMVPDGEGGYKRISEHSAFYSKTHKANGKPPTKAEWLAEAKRQLEGGHADSYVQQEYDSLKATGKPTEPKNWRVGYDELPMTQDGVNQKSQLLRSIANTKSNDKELNDVLDRAADIKDKGNFSETANIAWDVAHNHAASKATVAKANRLYELIHPKPKTAEALKRSRIEDSPTFLNDALLAKKAKLEAQQAEPASITPVRGAEPTPVTPEAPPLSVIAPKGTKMNRLTKGAKEGRQNVSEPVAEAVQGQHAVRNTQKLQDTAVAAADTAGVDQTIADAYKSLQAKPGHIADKDVALAQQAVERADAAGRTEDAVNLHDQLAEHLTRQGQSIQAASLFYNLSPAGKLYKAMRDIKKSGGEVTPELEAELRRQIDDVTNGVDPKLDPQIEKVRAQMDELNAKPNPTEADAQQMERLTQQHDDLAAKKEAGKQQAKDMALAKFQKTVREAMPQKKLNAALSVWKAGLLSGAKTQTGNLLSNATFAALKKVSDAPAAALDQVLAIFTKERTKAFTTKGTIQGAKQGVRSGIGTLRTGIDPRDIGNNGKLDVHGELNFKNPVIQKVFGQPSNLVFRGMNAADQPFYYAAAKNNLYDMATAAAKTKGLKGAEADTFIENMVANPTTAMAERAKLAAQKAVLGQDSKWAASLTHLAQEHPSVQVLAPFIKVPTNFLSRTLDYTPVGAVKAAVKAMGDRHAGRGFDQRAFVEAMGEATTGSAVLYLGAELAGHKLLSGAYPTDPKEQQRWKAEGITPNSIHIGNKWISLNYLGPMGLLLGAGKTYHDSAAEGNTGWTQALASFGKNLAGQSFLSGFNSFANAVNDPDRYLTGLKNSEAGSLIPSWANDLANIFDSHQRQASTAPETIQSRIPGARNALPIKTDVYGNELQQRTNPAQLTADPTRPSKDMSHKNDVVSEVDRLHNVDPSNADLQVTPVPPKSINIEGKVVKLTADQKFELQNKVGSEVQKKWGELIKTPEYKALSDTEKAKALAGLRGDVTTLTERQYVLDKNLGAYTKSPSKSVQALGMNQGQISDYATKTQQAGSGGLTLAKDLDQSSRKFLSSYNAMNSQQREEASYKQNDFDYKVLQAKFANNSANGTLSKAGMIKAQTALEKAKVGSNYSRDVRDLYGLTNDELTQYLASSDKSIDKSELSKKIIAYGDALAAAGIIKRNKFRNGSGVITLGKPSSKGGRTYKTAALPGVRTNPYKSGAKKIYRQTKLPTIKAIATHGKYKTAQVGTNINAKLRKA